MWFSTALRGSQETSAWNSVVQDAKENTKVSTAGVYDDGRRCKADGPPKCVFSAANQLLNPHPPPISLCIFC